jgi:hypothetical protein
MRIFKCAQGKALLNMIAKKKKLYSRLWDSGDNASIEIM